MVRSANVGFVVLPLVPTNHCVEVVGLVPRDLTLQPSVPNVGGEFAHMVSPPSNSDLPVATPGVGEIPSQHGSWQKCRRCNAPPTPSAWTCRSVHSNSNANSCSNNEVDDKSSGGQVSE